MGLVATITSFSTMEDSMNFAIIKDLNIMVSIWDQTHNISELLLKRTQLPLIIFQMAQDVIPTLFRHLV